MSAPINQGYDNYDTPGDNYNPNVYSGDGNQNQANDAYSSQDGPVSLFVGNFPFQCTEDDIGRAFADFGTCISVRIICDRYEFFCVGSQRK